jgi:hypothetical protein
MLEDEEERESWGVAVRRDEAAAAARPGGAALQKRQRQPRSRPAHTHTSLESAL